jgi:hypothetical protein
MAGERMTASTPGESLTALRASWRRGSLDPVAVSVLDRTAPGWRLDQRERAWRQRLAQYGLFLHRNDRAPSLSGGDTERMLARWVRRQRDAHADGRLPESRTKLLDRVPGHTW